MALDGVLANIPGLAGYLAMQNQQQRQALGGLQGAMGVLRAVQMQEEAQREAQMAPLRMQAMQAQVQQAQAAADQVRQRQAFFANAGQFMTPGAPAVAPGQGVTGGMDDGATGQITGVAPAENGAPAARPAEAPRFDIDRFIAAGVSQGALNPEAMLTRQAQLEDRKAAREQRMQELQLRLADARATAQEQMQFRRELAQLQAMNQRENLMLAASLRQSGGGGGTPRAPVGFRFSADGETLEPIPGGPKDERSKPLPTQALRLQQTELDAIGTASSISADLAAIDKQIESGQLNLGPIANPINRARNFAGVDNEASRNLASFQATLERLRNDSLRLNKGVQTEGDAVRAWNELVTNINSPGVVRQRLAEIQRINERAVQLRRMNINNIRANYGAGPIDLSEYENQQPAVGGGAGARPPAGGAGPAPAGVDPKLWQVMTPEERALWKK